MSLTRKVLRFGAYIPLIQGIGNRLNSVNSKNKNMVFWRTVSDLSLVIYFLSDHPLYFQRIGVTQFSKEFMQKLDFWNNIFWLGNTVLDILCDLVDLYQIQKEMQELKIQKSIIDKNPSSDPASKNRINQQAKELYQKYIAKVLNIARNLFDLPAIFHFLGYEKFGPKLCGICGTGSSSISLYNLWGK